MKTLLLRALCFAATAITLSTLAHGQPRPPAARDASMSRLDDTLLEKLDGTTVDAEYVAVDFEDVVDDLRERYELNIHVSWDNLDAVGVRKDKRLEVRLRQVSLATLLDMVLREAEPRPAELGYTVEGGVVVISRRGALARNTFIRTYEITDLIESGYALRRFGNTPVLSLQLTGREFLGGEARESGSSGGAGVGGGGAIFGAPGEDPSRLSKMERAQQIIDVVTESIDPNSWHVNGGGVATIRVFNGVLIIRNTIDGHRRVGDFLDLLRHTMPPPLDGEAIVVRLRADRAAEWRRSLAPRFPRLDAKEVRSLVAAPDAGDVLFRATTSGFNGQRMWFSALTQRDVVTSMAAQTAEQVNAFAPVTGFSTEGLELVVLPLLCSGEDALLLDVQMAWVPTTTVSARSVTLAGGETSGTIDQTIRSMRTVSTTAKVGLGEAIVLSVPRQLDDAGRPAEYEDWLIVHVSQPQARGPAMASVATVNQRRTYKTLAPGDLPR